jgi:hypothetical protein
MLHEVFMSRVLWLLLFFPSVVFAADHGLCFSSLTGETLQESSPGPAPLTALDTSLRHWYAMKAAMAVYDLPDLDAPPSSGDEFVTQFENFLNTPPPGYRYWSYSSDRASGMKFAVLEPEDPSYPWIFAFAGTQSTIDRFADLALGRAQVAKVEEMVSGLMDCLSFDRGGEPLAGKNWLVTGHSLGGGLAQIFAYLTQARRDLFRLTPHRLELVTFNGFGSLELVHPSAAIAEHVVPHMLTYNYFVTGDPVSVIGRHIGDTYELPMDETRFNPLENIKRHGLSTIESLVVQDNTVDFTIARRAEPPYSEPLNALKGVGAWLGFLVDNHNEKLTVQLEQITSLERAVNVIFQRDLKGARDREALMYFKSLALGLKADIEALPEDSLRRDMIADLDRLIRAIQNQTDKS